MSPERSPSNDPTVSHPTNVPPCTDFITAVPMSVTMNISLRKKYLTLVKTTHGETLLKVQKSNPKISKHRRRPQYRIYSDKGKELIVSCDKRYRWTITWPNKPHKQCKLTEHTYYCDAEFSNPFEEVMHAEMGRKMNKITNKETGKVLATVCRKSFWRREYILMMDKDVDVVLMTGFMMATAEILERRAAANAGNGSLLLIAGGGGAGLTGFAGGYGGGCGGGCCC